MKKILIAIISVIILGCITNSAFAYSKECTPDDFRTGAHGCQDKYWEQGINGPYEANCSDSSSAYAEGLGGCKDRYVVDPCTDDDFRKGKYGCKN